LTDLQQHKAIKLKYNGLSYRRDCQSSWYLDSVWRLFSNEDDQCIITINEEEKYIKIINGKSYRLFNTEAATEWHYEVKPHCCPYHVLIQARRKILERLRDKEFWIWNKNKHEQEYDRTKGLCCWNHCLPSGLPIKDGIRHPIYARQKQIVDALTSDSDDIPILSEASSHPIKGLRFKRKRDWLATKDRKFSGSQMAIITGNSTNLAIGLVNRANNYSGMELVKT
jgi:hypothetical protein